MVSKEAREGESGTRHLILAVMGVPGCGKTTLLGPLRRECGFGTIGEVSVKKIKSFQKYYQEGTNPSVTFRTQVEFLLEKYWRIKGSPKRHFKGVEAIARKKPVGIEPPPESDKIFARARLEGDPVFLDLYLGVYETLFPEGSFKADLVVYLKLSLEKMLERIGKRAKECKERKVELEESPLYWRRVWELHEEWVRQNRNSQEIITINADTFDFSRFHTEEVGREALLREFLAQTRYACIDPLTGNQKIPAEIIIPPSIVNYRPHPLAYEDRVPGSETRYKI
jgi:deoxyadenosine/deoxycytidine kinase